MPPRRLWERGGERHAERNFTSKQSNRPEGPTNEDAYESRRPHKLSAEGLVLGSSCNSPTLKLEEPRHQRSPKLPGRDALGAGRLSTGPEPGIRRHVMWFNFDTAAPVGGRGSVLLRQRPPAMTTS